MTDDPTLGRVCNLLCTVIEELRLLRSETGRKSAAAKQSKTLSPDDVRMLGELLPAVAAITGGESVTVNHFKKIANGRTPEAKALRTALDVIDLEPRALGKLLGRAMESETPVKGYFVHWIKPSRPGNVFCVTAESRLSREASRFAAQMRETITP